MSPAPCIDCGRRPKMRPRHRCASCYLRTRPIGEQIAEAQRRAAMVPESLRLSRRAGQKVAPEGSGFCAGCQSFRDAADFGKGATKCRACSSAVAHGSMVQRTYGITGDMYAELLALQDGRCAICRNKPQSIRLAVDHDHATGAVRGLVCSKCNHELLGAAHDSLALITAAWHYLNTPPVSGAWLRPEDAPPLAVGSGSSGNAVPSASRDESGHAPHDWGTWPQTAQDRADAAF